MLKQLALLYFHNLILLSQPHTILYCYVAVLVQEFQDRIAFLEQDREDLERVTQNLLDQERESSQIKLDAAVATAKRESMEQFQEFQQCTQKQLKNLYSTLCVNCQRRINTAL